jgi:hypothetical protein
MPNHFTQSDPYLCSNPGCRAEIGRLYSLKDGFYLLDTGGAGLARIYNGVCKHCGSSVYFSIRDQQLEKLVAAAAASAVTIDKDGP